MRFSEGLGPAESKVLIDCRLDQHERQRRGRERQENRWGGDAAVRARSQVRGDRADKEQHEADGGRHPDDRDPEKPEEEAGRSRSLQRGQHGEPGIGDADLAEAGSQEPRPAKGGNGYPGVGRDSDNGDSDVDNDVLAFL
jgi:hypothetical protein